jgi:hypothetical protein
MSYETGDDGYMERELAPSQDGADDAAAPEIDEIRDELLAAIEELGLNPGSAEHGGSAPAGCYLSTVPVDREGRSGVVVRWQLRDGVVPGEAPALQEVESVEILNEALGPLLLALGFPTEPYAVDGRWIVTGPRQQR